MEGLFMDAKALQSFTGLGRDACYALFHTQGFRFVVIGSKKYTTKEWVMQFLDSVKQTV